MRKQDRPQRRLTDDELQRELIALALEKRWYAATKRTAMKLADDLLGIDRKSDALKDLDEAYPDEKVLS